MRSAGVETKLREILEKETGFDVPSEYDGWKTHPGLSSDIDRVQLAELSSADLSGMAGSVSFSGLWLPAKQALLHIHVYQCTDANEDPTYAGEGDDEVMCSSEIVLPVQSWEGLWESLIYPDDIKTRLLEYIYTTVLYSDANVDREVHSSDDFGYSVDVCRSAYNIMEPFGSLARTSWGRQDSTLTHRSLIRASHAYG
jgi:hypothetical protein